MDVFNTLLVFFQNYGYAAVFAALLLCGAGVPIPEDVTLVAGGALAGLGYANAHAMVAVCMAGVLLGDGMMFSIGHFFGPKVLSFKPVARVMTPKRYAQVQDKFDRYGNRVLFVARFLPGLRTPIYITAGISRRIGFARFIFMDGLAATLSVPIWVYLGEYGASNYEWLFRKMRQFQAVIFIALAIGAVALAYYSVKRYARIRFFRQHRAYVMRQREEYLRKHNLKSSEADFRSEEYRRFHLKFLRKERLRLRNLFFFDFLFSRSKGKNKLLEPLSHLWGRRFLAKASSHWGEPAQDDSESDGVSDAQDAEEDGVGRPASAAGVDSLSNSGTGSENVPKGGVGAAVADRRGAEPGAGPKGPTGDEPNDPPGRDPASLKSRAVLEADLGRPRPGFASEKEQSGVGGKRAAQGNDEADAK